MKPTIYLLKTIMWPEPGRYVLAVSGGVDSVVLLDLFASRAQAREYSLVVAHVDHGIRPDSAADAEFVAGLAEQYGLRYESTMLALGPDASEDAARKSRYAFLDEVMEKHQAQAVIIAHHADDRLETSLHNVLRGTDRYGAAANMQRPGIMRPFLAIPKAALLDYAKEHELAWREDSTNQDVTYRRNQLRHELIPAATKLDPTFSLKYMKHMQALSSINNELDAMLATMVRTQSGELSVERSEVAKLDLRGVEVLVAYMTRRKNPDAEFGSAEVAELALAIARGTLAAPRLVGSVAFKLDVRELRAA